MKIVLHWRPKIFAIYSIFFSIFLFTVEVRIPFYHFVCPHLSGNKIDAKATAFVYLMSFLFLWAQLSFFSSNNKNTAKVLNLKILFWTQKREYAKETVLSCTVVWKFGWLIKWKCFWTLKDDDEDENRKLEKKCDNFVVNSSDKWVGERVVSWSFVVYF